MTQFYKLTTEKIHEVIAADLPKSANKLWLWICGLDPFGDRQVQITWERAKEVLGISRATFYRALDALTNAGLLINHKLSGFCVYLKNETNFSGMSKESQECVSPSQNWDSSLYKEFKILLDSPDSQSEEKEKIPDPEINTNGRSNGIKPKIPEKPATAEVNQNSSAKPVGQGEEKYSAARRTKKRTSKNQGFDWLPQGPWNIEGKLDPNFRDWLAMNWLKRYGGDFHDKQADVLAHFKKDPANLPIRWEQYQKEFVHRVENTQMRLANGCQIPEDQQRNLITHQRAVTAVLPPEMNPVAVVEPTIAPVLMPGVEEITRGLESVEPVADLSPSKNLEEAELAPTEIPSLIVAPECEPSPWESDCPTEEPQELTGDVFVSAVSVETPPENSSPTPDSEYTILPDGTRLKVFQRQPKSEPVAPEQAQAFRQMMQGLLKGFGGKREVCPKPQSELERLNQWLFDPALREEAIHYARRSPSYKYCPDTDQIIHCEEF
ncbi:hypothetical protein IQ217_16680 [Synechocystis salina LEGE 00031]|uniref:Helix-turn-helix domain-containing protein n=1 Tax=Synechocystis salina LEGE 00031 TaxID=1828736 RepID=A0ABR9VYX8_9SYNC|nr:hypothetical protein [Synechocystis salina]MBE9255441.1 hypothetical protein [Synechocystis salina LEGE 00031]